MLEVTQKLVELLDLSPIGGINHVMQHGFAGHRMQNLRQCGLHSGTLAGGQDHDV